MLAQVALSDRHRRVSRLHCVSISDLPLLLRLDIPPNTNHFTGWTGYYFVVMTTTVSGGHHARCKATNPVRDSFVLREKGLKYKGPKYNRFLADEDGEMHFRREASYLVSALVMNK